MPDTRIPPALMKRHTEEFDKLVQNTAFSVVFGSARTAGPETAVKHAQLATEEGGLGLKSLAANADVTYLSAWNDTMREVKEGRLPQTALGGLTADKLRAVEEVLQIESTLDNVKQSLMEFDTMR